MRNAVLAFPHVDVDQQSDLDARQFHVNNWAS